MTSRVKWAALLLGIGAGTGAWAQRRPETLTVTTRLVVLDATVLDKAGNVVTQPLGRDDFLIEENKRPQAIYTFESAADHAEALASGNVEKSSVLIFVLDELNYAYQPLRTDRWNMMQQGADEEYERNELIAFAESQPEMLDEPIEVLALTHHGYQIMSEPTRDKAALLKRVKRHNPGLGSAFRDYLEETGGGSGMSANGTVTKDSMGAVWSLALEERGQPGRKLVMWLGLGGPSQQAQKAVNLSQLSPGELHQREIADLLVEARITLDILSPGGVPPEQNVASLVQQVMNYRFDSGFGFSTYVAATGGRVMQGNDIRGEIQDSVHDANRYYTMSYRPTDHDLNGAFRRIRVTVKGHPEWTVLTKAGYYGMPFGGSRDREHQLQTDLSVATFEAMPFSAVNMTLMKIERLKGTDKARFTFRVDSDDLQWRKDAATGKQVAELALSGAALGTVFMNSSLASQVATWKLNAPVGVDVADVGSTVKLTMSIPEKTKRLRFVVRDMSNDRMGTVDLNPAAVARAPEIEVTTPALQVRGSATAK